MTYPFGVQITLVTRTKTGTDAYGDDVMGETDTTVTGVFIPGMSSEIIAGGDVVTTQPTVHLPDTVDPTAFDAIEVSGVRYEVDGEPQTWPQHPMTGWRPAFPVVVPLRRVTG